MSRSSLSAEARGHVVDAHFLKNLGVSHHRIGLTVLFPADTILVPSNKSGSSKGDSKKVSIVIMIMIKIIKPCKTEKEPLKFHRRYLLALAAICVHSFVYARWAGHKARPS